MATVSDLVQAGVERKFEIIGKALNQFDAFGQAGFGARSVPLLFDTPSPLPAQVCGRLSAWTAASSFSKPDDVSINLPLRMKLGVMCRLLSLAARRCSCTRCV